MLLTYPNKQSLIRNLNEYSVDDVFLIIANYKSLAGWNLIPLRRLSLFLGPNSAGKSLIYEAIEVLRGLDLITNDGFGKRWEDLSGAYEGRPSFGFSMPYILNGSLSSSAMSDIYVCSRDIAAGGRNDGGWDGLGAFFALEGFAKGSFLYEDACNIRYTMITEEVTTLEVYLDGDVAARKNIHYWVIPERDGEGNLTGLEREAEGDEDQFDFAFLSKSINTIYWPSVEYRVDSDDGSEDEMESAGNFYGKYGEVKTNPDFIGVIENRVGAYNLRASEFPEFIYHSLTKHNFGSPQAAIGMFLSLFTAPYLRFIEYVDGKESSDVRGIEAHGIESWVEERLVSSKADLVLNELKNRTSIDERESEEHLVEAVLKFIAPTVPSAEDPNLLPALNRWLRESAFLSSDYQLHVDLSVNVGLTSGNDDWIVNDCSLHLQKILRKKKEVHGSVYLIDKNGSRLRFSDVGAGFSQVFPLLLGLLTRLYLVFKQPELHLHPKLQSRVADCFVETIFTDRHANLSKIRIVETHSEHFVLRLLRRLRESYFDELFHSSLTLYPEDVAFVYFQPTSEGTLIHMIDVLPSGEFVEGWPDGFFDERSEDLWGQPSPRGR